MTARTDQACGSIAIEPIVCSNKLVPCFKLTMMAVSEIGRAQIVTGRNLSSSVKLTGELIAHFFLISDDLLRLVRSPSSEFRTADLAGSVRSGTADFDR